MDNEKVNRLKKTENITQFNSFGVTGISTDKEE
jgi:hypothetical protein